MEILADYNQRYGQNFDLGAHDRFKKDVAARLAHKRPYGRLEKEPDKQIDLLIVVDQMLTGFDSKWINILYLDKVLRYENIIQAFSRANRLFGPDKPFGVIRYYRYPHTMERHIEEAVKLYSGDKPLGLFADRLEDNLEALNAIYDDIAALFTSAGIANFVQLPDEVSERAQFAKWFRQFNNHLEAAKIQGFIWTKLSYSFGKGKQKTAITLHLDEMTYATLLQRYKELATGGGGLGLPEVPYEIDPYITEIDAGIIDANYMDSRFEKYLKTLRQDGASPAQIQQTLDELHKSFASLNQEEQKYANIFLNDIQRGDIILEPGKTFRDYITDYQSQGKISQIAKITELLGLDADKLLKLMSAGATATNLNEFGRFKDLKNTVDKAKAKAYFEERDGEIIPIFKVNIKIDRLLQEFILKGGFDLA